MAEKTNQKTDIVSKELMDKSQLIRFVRGPSCQILPDFAENFPGRGMWVKADKESLQIAKDKKMFSKACQLDCKPEDDYIEKTAVLLKKRILNLLSMAKKTGALTLGVDKITTKIGNANILIIASDSGHDNKDKLLHKFEENSIKAENKIVLDFFDSTELQHAFGQDTIVVYAMIKTSPLSKKIIADYRKYLGII